MSGELVLSLENVKLSYKVLNTVSIKNIVGKKHLTSGKYFALNNISFDMKKGEVIGIVGGNGAGKSTLLKLLAGIYEQDSGNVNINAKSVSLLALGTGFQRELSGYSNIYLNGLLLGFTRKEIDEKIDKIIDFSGIRDFIYNPVRTYSSGMKSRLAFSIACHIEPELLLIDEVLGVGDIEFREKSSRKIRELVAADRSVMIVSHNLPALRDLCPRCIWMEKGEIIMYDESVEVHKAYNKSKFKEA